MFSPAPRFQLVSHEDGDVLLIATERAPQLVPSISSGKMTYHLRIHTSTIQVPEFLISDLLIGRRQRPFFDIGPIGAEWLDEDDKLALNLRRLRVRLAIQNRSMVRAEKVQIGLVGWTMKEPLRNDHVLMYVDAQMPEIDASGIGEWCPSLLVQRSGEERPIPAFEHLDISTWSGTLWVPCFTLPREDGSPFALCRFAVFVAAANAPPAWFQVDVAISRRTDWQGVERVRRETACSRVPQGVRPVMTYLLGTKARTAFEELRTRVAFKEVDRPG